MNQAQFTVGTTAVKIFTGPGNVSVRLSSGSTPYLGSSSVSQSDGLTLASLAPFQASVADGAELWAIVATGTADLRVLSWY